MAVADTIDAHRMEIVGHCRLDGKGDCMHVNVGGGVAYLAHMGYNENGVSIVDVSNPAKPELISRILRPAGTHSHKVQLLGNVLLVNHERQRAEMEIADAWSSGIAVYDVADPARPKQIGMYETRGGGVHRMAWWEGRYCYASATDDGYRGRFLQIVDMADPTRPVEAGRWWFPGQKDGESRDHWLNARGQPTLGYHLHHALPYGDDRAYGGYWDAGICIFDVSDKANPKLISRLQFGEESINTHTAFRLPGRDVLVVTEEQLSRTPHSTHAWTVDISDEVNPKIMARFPLPAGEPARPHKVRWGPHNVHEMKPATLIDPNLVLLTYFAGGLRAYDVSDPYNPTEIAHLVPPAPPGQAPTQLNDITATPDGLIYVTDRYSEGLYIVRMER